MTKLALAAAVAAGMMTFAASAQEAPGGLVVTGQLPMVAAKPAGKQARLRSTTARMPAKTLASVGFADQGQIAVSFADEHAAPAKLAAAPAAKTATVQARKPASVGVDRIKTASVPKQPKGRRKVELVAQARTERAGTTKAQALAPVVSKGSYGAIIARYATAYGVPVSLAHAVIRVESNYRPGAVGGAGEIGLMQIKPSTARGLGYTGSAKGLHNPETNIKFGMKYLGMARQLGGGSTCGTILKYNAGHGAKRMNPVSAAYCSKVKRLIGA